MLTVGGLLDGLQNKLSNLFWVGYGVFLWVPPC